MNFLFVESNRESQRKMAEEEVKEFARRKSTECANVSKEWELQSYNHKDVIQTLGQAWAWISPEFQKEVQLG